MNKYLKMFGLLLLYYGLPILVNVALFMTPFLANGPLKDVQKICPSGSYGIVDPVTILFLFLVFMIFRKKSLWKTCSFTKAPASNLILGALIGLFMGMFTYSLIGIDSFNKHFGSLGGSIKAFIITGNIFMLSYTVIINSISKEMQFRGLMLNEMRSVLPVSIAIIGQALLYASQVKVACDWVLTIYSFIGAIMFGIVFYLGKSIWASILTQIGCTMGMVLIDRTSIVKLFTPGSSLYLFILSIVIVATLVLVMYRNHKTSEKVQAPGSVKA